MKRIVCIFLGLTLILTLIWFIYNNRDTTIIEVLENENEQTQEVFEENLPLSGKRICVDAGHGLNSYNKQEPIAPNSPQTKNAFAKGTHGKNQTEEELNLTIALKLEEELKKLGAAVYMTRTTHECDMTNIDRAKFANELNVDLSVKIHADGVENSSAHGISVLVPSNKYLNDQSLVDKSRKAGEYILKEIIEATGAANRGISTRSDLTGFNWTTVPIVLIEVGFMTNLEEDVKLDTEEYQNKIVYGITKGLLTYFGNE